MFLHFNVNFRVSLPNFHSPKHLLGFWGICTEYSWLWGGSMSSWSPASTYLGKITVPSILTYSFPSSLQCLTSKYLILLWMKLYNYFLFIFLLVYRNIILVEILFPINLGLFIGSSMFCFVWQVHHCFLHRDSCTLGLVSSRCIPIWMTLIPPPFLLLPSFPCPSLYSSYFFFFFLCPFPFHVETTYL